MSAYNQIRMSIGKTTIFKLFLLVGIVLISVVFVWYTVDVIDQLKEDAQRSVISYVRLWQLAASEQSTGGEIQIIFEEVIKKASFPVVITDLNGQPLSWRNIHGIADNDSTLKAKEQIHQVVQEMKADKGEIPLKFGEHTISYFYYGDSKIIRQLQWMPFIEIGLVAAFVLIGFIGFQNIRRSEERHIWVGMAKETAHQLGTPISSLMGWLELLSAENEGKESNSDIENNETYEQMKTDVTRLQKIANRFGKIGSKPELVNTDINTLMAEIVEYFERRLPFEGKGVRIEFKPVDNAPVCINGELFSWAIENIVKNALQAVDPLTGWISISVLACTTDRDFIKIEIADNGKGIPTGIARKLFRPGFTTKKRGWGLGLTLVKRIIEEYHSGRVVLLRSQPGETVFQITLPINKNDKVKRLKQYD
ncbi:MAG: HAMP domain-containing sensor histidine kinase [Candidatus Zixiibacteriota bacterium]